MPQRVSAFAAVLWAASLCFAALGFPQAENSQPNWRIERKLIEQDLANDLQPIADWCRNNDLPKLTVDTLRWYQDRDLERLFIFIPQESGRVPPTSPVEREWSDQLNIALDKHAERVFELAKRASKAEAGATAYQLLHEVLYYNPDHEQVRKILGHRKTETGWQIAADGFKFKRAKQPHPTINWPADDYFIVSTPHFNIASQASEEMTQVLAEKLERWQGVWRQAFFEYWNRPRTVARWIEGKGKSRIPTKKFDIVFFANKQQYIDQLSRWVKGVEDSTGYYNDSIQTSFFFASNELNTWRHEVTHQLFQESIRTKESPFDDGFIWLGEGIAMYFESLSDFGPYVTLGGFESERLQYARIRRFREGFYVPLGELSSLGRKEFQMHTNKSRLYSQSAGLTHMLMDYECGSSQRKLVEFLKLMYTGKLKPGSFEKVLGASFDKLDEQYVEFLRVRSEQVEKRLSLPEERTELALPAAKLTDGAYELIGQCSRLEWLDLTANRVTRKQIEMLKGCDQLNKLFLTNCAIDSETLHSLGQFDQLRELDLSGSSVSDSILASLKNTGLENLRMTKTNISDAGLRHLADFSQLKLLEVSGTKVTDSGVEWLLSRLPDLKIVRE